jgi:hypothetical protein
MKSLLLSIRREEVEKQRAKRRNLPRGGGGAAEVTEKRKAYHRVSRGEQRRAEGAEKRLSGTGRSGKCHEARR